MLVISAAPQFQSIDLGADKWFTPELQQGRWFIRVVRSSLPNTDRTGITGAVIRIGAFDDGRPYIV